MFPKIYRTLTRASYQLFSRNTLISKQSHSGDSLLREHSQNIAYSYRTCIVLCLTNLSIESLLLIADRVLRVRVCSKRLGESVAFHVAEFPFAKYKLLRENDPLEV